jgi:hypothetical protein
MPPLNRICDDKNVGRIGDKSLTQYYEYSEIWSVCSFVWFVVLEFIADFWKRVKVNLSLFLTK